MTNVSFYDDNEIACFASQERSPFFEDTIKINADGQDMTETLIPMAGAGKRFSQFISSAVDINPKKQGTFIAGTGHPIISYEQLKDWGITCVIVVNPNFFDEIKILMEKNNLNIKLINLTKSQL